MKIKLTTVYVDDQTKALQFYTEILGLVKKADFSQGAYRWLTVASAEDPEGTQLQLAAATDPADRAFQQAKFEAGAPALMLNSDDVKADCERIEARGGAFRLPPTEVPGSIIAKIDDTCGNTIQLVQLKF